MRLLENTRTMLIDKLNKFLGRFEAKTHRKLTPLEKYSIRLGWFGTAFFMTAPHLLPSKMGIVIYFLAGLFCLPQVLVAKQWNLVLVNINVMIAYMLLYFK